MEIEVLRGQHLLCKRSRARCGICSAALRCAALRCTALCDAVLCSRSFDSDICKDTNHEACRSMIMGAFSVLSDATTDDHRRWRVFFFPTSSR